MKRFRGFRMGACLCLPLLLCAAGCVSFDPAEARRAQTEGFTNELARLEAEWLAGPLSLERCVEIAMTNNYEVRKADLDAQLGRFSRDMAFSAFLPQVSASATRIDYDKDPVLNSQRFTSGGVDVGLALLMPSTWFLYDEARHGRAAAELAAGYVRQRSTRPSCRNGSWRRASGRRPPRAKPPPAWKGWRARGSPVRGSETRRAISSRPARRSWAPRDARWSSAAATCCGRWAFRRSRGSSWRTRSSPRGRARSCAPRAGDDALFGDASSLGGLSVA